MRTVDVNEATSTLARLVEVIESGLELEVVIEREGRPAARLVPIRSVPDPSRRIGAARGQFEVPDDIDIDAERIARQFEED
ncbi:type II toxin-antitoxin system Phd/YefM family antitoxin [Leptothrix discophora]|uniref:Prevent-host-death protein n=1 Tax=Leptothrix discophora TaxID=89 RepID=A0ABT9G056_LEPDI|nr:prevent-host-death protein [Leptothrix discophora]MDP4299843.1 prevent-host-death protein [Leptothrix discophora]